MLPLYLVVLGVRTCRQVHVVWLSSLQSRIAESKTPKILNIVVTKKHEDSHVELSTSSTGLSFLIVTTNTKTPKNSHVDFYIKLTNPFGAIVAIKNILNYPPISLSLLGLLIL